MSLDWNRLSADCVAFTQRLIQTPSMSTAEGTIAQLIAAELRQLGVDEVWLDGIGNVCGRVYGQDRSLGALVLNTHLDHVDPGDPNLWPVPPYSGQIVEGRIRGRGACDIKGPLAVQVYSLAALKRMGVRPRRDVVFTGVVQEETGGAGAVYWAEHLDYPVDLVVIGEPSDNQIALGHRGGYAYWVKFHGRSVHASVPERGQNPNYQLATFLLRVEQTKDQLSSHPVLGATTVAPTIVEVDTKSQNVTPAWTRVLLDFRSASESPKSLALFISRCAEGLDFTLEEGLFGGEPEKAEDPLVGFYTPETHPAVQRAQQLMNAGCGRELPLTSYRFATDGRHFVKYNLPMIGFAPGEEFVAHTVQENVSITALEESLRGYVHLLQAF
ncbi:MAG: M20 family metallopeptidase [Chloroflexi bacterium]|nr:M20 family metallopeptidase [Chloroflexota bacterium]MBP8058843.1 M20 family metallopeptidase [Chloroflexota bacterium]